MARSESAPVGIGVIGLGFMGRTHIAAFAKADAAGFRNRLVAVADRDPERRAGHAGTGGNLATGGTGRIFDPTTLAAYEHPQDLLADRKVELVSICTHTDTHVDLAIAALQAGKHVLVEKPVALSPAQIERLLAVARRSERLCMPAMCMRFWPAWEWLKERVVDRSLGALRSVKFQRLGTRPAWGGGFYADLEKSGGALVDLHIHDADFVLHLLGNPDSVVATGDLEHVTAGYRYASGPCHVVAEGGWDHTPGFPFRMRYTAIFETATADFDISRDPQLLLCRDGKAEPVAVATTDGYDGEVRHLIAAIRSGDRKLRATLQDALELAHLLDRERAALKSKGV